MELSKKAAQALLAFIAGANGTIPISGTEPLGVPCIGFEAWENSEIASIKDVNGKERISDIGWKSKSIDATKRIWFGFEASSVSLASGHGQLFRSQPPFEL